MRVKRIELFQRSFILSENAESLIVMVQLDKRL